MNFRVNYRVIRVIKKTDTEYALGAKIKRIPVLAELAGIDP